MPEDPTTMSPIHCLYVTPDVTVTDLGVDLSGGGLVILIHEGRLEIKIDDFDYRRAQGHSTKGLHEWRYPLEGGVVARPELRRNWS